jgi:CRP/FNR family cyclic AMP-dependent transcriptional regulator
MSNPINLDPYIKEWKEFTQGQDIFVEGERGELMYLVKDGEVEIVKDGQVIDTVRPGEVFGEMALIDDSPRSASARARTACRLVPVDEYNFLFLVQHAPYFSLQVMRTLAGRLRGRMGAA